MLFNHGAPFNRSLLGRSLAIALVAAASPYSACFAQAASNLPNQQLTPIVVTAARIDQTITDALPATTLISREDIERSQVRDALELLRRAAGVEVVQQGGIGRQAGIFLRGSESRHTLVLIDGVPINNLNFNLPALEHLVTPQIERIEIVRGNVSALYGSQAVGGVIQIFTRQGEGAPQAQVQIGGGSRNTRQAFGAVNGAIDRLRYGLTVSSFDTDGFNILNQSKRPNTNPDQDGYNNLSGSAQLAYAIATGHEIGARWLRSRGKFDYDSEFGPRTQADEAVQVVETLSAYSRNRFTSAWTSTLTLSQSKDQLDAQITAFPYFVNSKSTLASWQNDIALHKDWTATLAAERLKQAIDSDTTYDIRERTDNTVRVGLTGKIGAHQAQLNLRHDDYSDFGGATTYYAGYGYALTQQWKLIASTSTAFNAPSFNDLFYPGFSNPALKPEKTRSYEIGTQYAEGDTLARATLFSTKYRDLIGFDQSFNIENIGRAKVEGLELSIGTSWEHWHAASALTLQNATNTVTDTWLVRRARRFANLTLGRDIGAANVEANWHLTGDRLDRSGTTRTLGGYGLLDLAARWQFARDWSVGAKLANVFGKEYENVWGYNSAPRSVFVNLEWRLR